MAKFFGRHTNVLAAGSLRVIFSTGAGSLATAYFFAFNSNISFSGCAKFVNGSLPENTTANFKEGGALTLYQTMLSLQGEARFECNHAKTGGAILAIESEFFLSNQV